MFSRDFLAVREMDVHNRSIFVMCCFESVPLVVSELRLRVMTSPLVYYKLETMNKAIDLCLAHFLFEFVSYQATESPGLAILDLTPPRSVFAMVQVLITVAPFESA